MIDGIILSTHVPATIITSAWRGEAGSGITPNRMMSWRGIIDAAISIAQHARPNWSVHSEYFRPQLKRVLERLRKLDLIDEAHLAHHTQSRTLRPHA